MDYLPTEITIKLVDQEKLKAIVALKFGKIVVRGFRVMPSKLSNELWVVPPSYNCYGKYHPIFFVEDKAIWEKICEMILAKLDERLADQDINNNLLDEVFNNNS